MGQGASGEQGARNVSTGEPPGHASAVGQGAHRLKNS